MAQRLHKISPQFFDPAHRFNWNTSGGGAPLPPAQKLQESFNVKNFPAGSSSAPPPSNNFPEWSVHVPGQGRARPPIQVDFLGTTSQEKPDPFASKEKNQRRAEELKKQAEKNKETLEQAIFILSQSPTGRAVLEEMSREGYGIVFDDRRTDERGAGGLCDPGSKTIILHSHDNAEYLALLLGHESVHAVQNTRHDLFPSSRHKPEVGIKLSFAIEADAYAQQTQIALELSYGDPLGPPDQVRYKGPSVQMRERFPDILQAAEKVMDTEDALQNGATVAAAFQAFYDNFYLRTFYEDAHIDWANLYAPEVQGSFPWLQKHFSKDVDSDWVKERIQHKGVAYLKKHAPHLDFNDTRHAGLTAETHAKISKFYKKFLPKEKPPALKTFGVHMQNATSWVLGLTASIHMIVRQGHEPTTPPLRTPPRRKWGLWE